jgi:hypothetical protein
MHGTVSLITSYDYCCSPQGISRYLRWSSRNNGIVWVSEAEGATEGKTLGSRYNGGKVSNAVQVAQGIRQICHKLTYLRHCYSFQAIANTSEAFYFGNTLAGLANQKSSTLI